METIEATGAGNGAIHLLLLKICGVFLPVSHLTLMG